MCWVDVPGCNARSGVRACNDGAMCGYDCGSPGLPARLRAPRAHPLGQHYQPTVYISVVIELGASCSTLVPSL